MTSGNAVTAEVQLIDVKQLAAVLGMHPRSMWRLVALAEAGQGNFPKPLRIGPKTIRWRLSDVQAYLAALAGERRQ
jgi:predicted DNA-binding transcriptional regulator AlpA